MSNYTYVTTQPALDSALATLKQTEELAFDLEFDRNYHAYGFNLCLIQVSDGHHAYLIDPFPEEINLSPLFQLFEKSGQRLIAFSCSEDIRLLHSLGCFPSDVCDLSLATHLLNYPPASLDSYLETILGIDTAGSSQKSNWMKRPLTDEQIRYAARDVQHLHDLKEELFKQAEEKQVLRWIQEENQQWNHADFSDLKDPVVREKEKQNLTEYEWHIYKTAAHFFDRKAEILNKPMYKVVQKHVLQRLARKPQSAGELHTIRGIHPALKKRGVSRDLANTLQQAAEEAAEKKLSKTDPASKPPTREQKNERREHRELVQQAKQELFDPIKAHIEKAYGEGTSTFLFSNRLVEEMVLDDNLTLPPYKEELIRQTAKQLNLSTEPYLSFSENR
ncbi:MAG: hypothetical protein ACNA78_01060 [Balneolaceae bacterium]